MESQWEQMAAMVGSIFMNDGTLTMPELDLLMKKAFTDDILDEREKNVLKGLFNQLAADKVSPEVWKKITEIRKKYGI